MKTMHTYTGDDSSKSRRSIESLSYIMKEMHSSTKHLLCMSFMCFQHNVKKCDIYKSGIPAVVPSFPMHVYLTRLVHFTKAAKIVNMNCPDFLEQSTPNFTSHFSKFFFQVFSASVLASNDIINYIASTHYVTAGDFRVCSNS